MNARPISESTNQGCGTVALGLFGSVFLIVGLILFWFFLVRPVWLSSSAKSWPSTTGKITSAKLDVDTSGEGTSYSAKFTYEYRVGGVLYENDQYNFLNVSGGRKSAKNRLAEHPIHSETEIFYNPSDPQQSVMNRDLGWGIAFGFIPLIFVGIGSVVLFGVLRLGWGKTAKAATNPNLMSQSTMASQNLAASANNASQDLDNAFDGPQKLKPETSRLATFFIVLVICLIFNGIAMAVGLGIVNNGFNIISMLVSAGFGLAGLGLLAGTLYCFLALFNPVIEIALNNGAVPLGEDLDIAWEVIGQASRFQKLTIKIQGQEEATYQQGTDTRTDTQVFKIIEVAETNQRDEFQFGTATVNIPLDTMHTFKSEHNEIKWSVVVHGDIPFWPDVNQNMVFRIKP